MKSRGATGENKAVFLSPNFPVYILDSTHLGPKHKAGNCQISFPVTSSLMTKCTTNQNIIFVITFRSVLVVKKTVIPVVENVQQVTNYQ